MPGPNGGYIGIENATPEDLAESIPDERQSTTVATFKRHSNTNRATFL